jgi:hypothetical protein
VAKTDKKESSAKSVKKKPALAKTYYQNKQKKQDLPESVTRL